MKFLFAVIAVMCITTSAQSQEALFLSVGYVARGADLFMGAAPTEVQFVSTQVEAFEAVPKQPDQAPKPVSVQAPQHHVQAPKQVPLANSAYYYTGFRRQAPIRRGWAERRSERRSARANRGGFFRGGLGGC